jgi:hypothetical protein
MTSHCHRHHHHRSWAEIWFFLLYICLLNGAVHVPYTSFMCIISTCINVTYFIMILHIQAYIFLYDVCTLQLLNLVTRGRHLFGIVRWQRFGRCHVTCDVYADTRRAALRRCAPLHCLIFHYCFISDHGDVNYLRIHLLHAVTIVHRICSWCIKSIMLSVLHECETWPLTWREERILRVFENRVLRRIFGSKGEEVVGGWRRLHNDVIRR